MTFKLFNFSLSIFVSLSLFSLSWSVSLKAKISEKTHFFSRKKNRLIFAYFRFKRKWAAHPKSVPLIYEFCEFKEKNVSQSILPRKNTFFHIKGKHRSECILHLLRLQQMLCLASDLKSLFEIVGGKAYSNPGNNSRYSLWLSTVLSPLWRCRTVY